MAEAVGDVYDVDGVLVVRRITVDYRLAGVTEGLREKADRAHELHARYCPVARSISPQIEIETRLTYV